jgi:hypothetical protein
MAMPCETFVFSYLFDSFVLTAWSLAAMALNRKEKQQEDSAQTTYKGARPFQKTSPFSHRSVNPASRCISSLHCPCPSPHTKPYLVRMFSLTWFLFQESILMCSTISPASARRSFPSPEHSQSATLPLHPPWSTHPAHPHPPRLLHHQYLRPNRPNFNFAREETGMDQSLTRDDQGATRVVQCQSLQESLEADQSLFCRLGAIGGRVCSTVQTPC